MCDLYIIGVQLVPQPLPVDGEDREVVGGVGGDHHPLPRQAEGGGRGQLPTALQGPEEGDVREENKERYSEKEEMEEMKKN